MAAPAIPQPLVLQFDDNRLLPILYGEHDRHLARIEQSLGVSLMSRGNQIAVSGDAPAVAQARQVLNQLYQRLKRGFAVDFSEIDAAIRLSQPDESTEPSLFGTDGVGHPHPAPPHHAAQRRPRRNICASCRSASSSSASAPPAPARPISPWPWPSPI